MTDAESGVGQLPDPVYHDEFITLYEGEANDLLPLLPWDDRFFVVTDPPYGTGGFRRDTTRKDFRSIYDKKAWDDGDVEWIGHCRCDGILTFWGAEYTYPLLHKAMSCGFTKHRQLFVRKPNPKPNFPQAGERAISWSMEPVWFMSVDGVYLYGKDDFFQGIMPRKGRDREGVGHPYQKSIAMMSWLIDMLNPKYSVIVDPYSGSGTTGIAAKLAKRRSIMIENKREYVDMQIERYRQLDVGLHIPVAEQREILPGFE